MKPRRSNFRKLQRRLSRGLKKLSRRPGAPAVVWLTAAAVLCSAIIVACVNRPRTSITTTAAATEPDMRVRICKDIPTAKFEGPDQFQVHPDRQLPRTLPGPIIVKATAQGRIELWEPGGSVHEFGEGQGVDITPLGPEGALPPVTVEGGQYSGRFRAQPAAVGSMADAPRLDVINMVPMETYLVGVVAKELYRNWPATAYMTQAVCARTYALHERQRSQARGESFDVEAGEQDQAYSGFTQLPVAVRGVQATKGVVLTYNGQVLRAYYSSTCGGRCGSAADVWPTGAGYEYNLAPPLQAQNREHFCQSSNVYRWTVTRDTQELSSRLRAWGKANGHPIGKIGRIRSAEPTDLAVTGRPRHYAVTDDAGRTYTLKGDELRVACNNSAAGEGLKPIARETMVRSGDLELKVRGASTVIAGRGFGHGVGMCQWCVKALADRGDDWRTIIVRFYPGAKLERAY
jgi:stage II sporulation protein D